MLAQIWCSVQKRDQYLVFLEYDLWLNEQNTMEQPLFQLRLGEMLGTDEVDGARWVTKLPIHIVKAGII